MSQSNSSFTKSLKPIRNKTEKAYETKPKNSGWQRNSDKRKQEAL